MGRPKKKVELKGPVRLRERPMSNGRKSLFLDIYYKGERKVKYLKLYLVPETDYESRRMNAETLSQANAIKEEMLHDLTNKAAGIKDNSHKAKMAFCEWMRIYAEETAKHCSESSKNWLWRVAREVSAYDPHITLAEVGKEFLLGFLEHLSSRDALNSGRKKMAKSTVFCYMVYVRAALNKAVRDNLITSNPFKGITKRTVSVREHKREYLTVEEIKRLMATPCHREDIKAAFLFSCFTGLRFSDIENLRWKDIVRTATHWQVEIVQYKTGIELYLPLNMNARKWLPEQDADASSDDKLFPRLTRYYGQTLRTWMKKAGIDKEVSFHVARHSYATLCLTAGVDIYTTSQLMGHTTIRHTQRYARIINTKKEFAISMLDEAFE